MGPCHDFIRHLQDHPPDASFSSDSPSISVTSRCRPPPAAEAGGRHVWQLQLQWRRLNCAHLPSQPTQRGLVAPQPPPVGPHPLFFRMAVTDRASVEATIAEKSATWPQLKPRPWKPSTNRMTARSVHRGGFQTLSRGVRLVGTLRLMPRRKAWSGRGGMRATGQGQNGNRHSGWQGKGPLELPAQGGMGKKKHVRSLLTTHRASAGRLK